MARENSPRELCEVLPCHKINPATVPARLVMAGIVKSRTGPDRRDVPQDG